MFAPSYWPECDWCSERTPQRISHGNETGTPEDDSLDEDDEARQPDDGKEPQDTTPPDDGSSSKAPDWPLYDPFRDGGATYPIQAPEIMQNANSNQVRHLPLPYIFAHQRFKRDDGSYEPDMTPDSSTEEPEATSSIYQPEPSTTEDPEPLITSSVTAADFPPPTTAVEPTTPWESSISDGIFPPLPTSDVLEPSTTMTTNWDEYTPSPAQAGAHTEEHPCTPSPTKSMAPSASKFLSIHIAHK
jgi:hypothetical protein